MENTSSTTKFPFVSVGNTPQITAWTIQNSATSASTVPSSTAYAAGATQILADVKFQVGVTGAYGGTTFFPINVNSAYDDFPHHWGATMDADPNSCTIFLFDQ